MPETHRLFFALWPAEALRKQIAAQTAPAVAQVASRPVPAHHLHVTLVFLGNVPAAYMPTLIELGRTIRFPGCELTFDRFAVWQPAQVLVLKASAMPEPLLQLVDTLQQRLRQAGFGIEDRSYCAHVTLARKVREVVSDMPTANIHWSAPDFVLAESMHGPDGVQYQVLETFSGTSCST
ncbi:MAG: RNA 2',3'-cyclic phosphodiesterase [Steroidobacteraceae bacterium]